jgi:methylaspartate ammonia-lyase
MIVKWVERRIVEYLRWINVRDVRIGLSGVHLRMHCRLHILLSKTTT